jgi:uncharacterized protein (TIGR02145 family)
MKTLTFSFLLITAVFELNAQNYQVNFAGTGASTTVDSVKVENLSQCTSLAFKGTDTLNLTSVVGLDENGNPHQYNLNIYPNPSPGNFSVELESNSEGQVCISLYDIYGIVVLQRTDFFSKGKYLFQISGIDEGIYIIKVETDQYLYTAKLIIDASGPGFPVIKNDEPACAISKPFSPSQATGMKVTEKSRSIISMQFNEGDTLKLTGRSGNYRTVSMLFPDQNQTVTFNFINCSDADSNHYAVVQIGPQLWMQENLKTTKYCDGSDIPNVPDSAAWANLTTGAYCDYHNLPAEGAYYVHLYNFFAVNDSRKMCPEGWHVPSHGEWNIMEKFLDGTVDTTALGGTGTLIGRILKEGCDTRWAYLDSTYGLNSAGFTALCSNFRNATGAWSLAPGDNHDDCFWTSTSYNANSAWFRSLRWCYSDIYSLFPMKRAGHSVRCIKDS